MPKVDIPAVITDSYQINTPTDEHSGHGADTDPGEEEERVEDIFDSKPEKDVDPTRYGDWEKNGRCIDF